MNNLEIYKELFKPWQIVTGHVIENNGIAALVDLDYGGRAIIYSINVDDNVERLPINEKIEFMVIGFTRGGLVSLALSPASIKRFSVNAKMMRGRTVITTDSGMAIQLNDELHVYKTTLRSKQILPGRPIDVWICFPYGTDDTFFIHSVKYVDE